MTTRLSVEAFNVEELQRGLALAPELSFKFLNQEMGRIGNRVRRAFVSERLSGPPGIRGGEWKRQKNRHVKVFQRGSDLASLRNRIQLSRFLRLHETGGVLQAHRKGAKALRIPIGDRRGVRARGLKFRRDASGNLEGLVFIQRPGKAPILAEKVGSRLQPRYLLVKSVTIPARLQFRPFVRQAYQAQLPKLQDALARAVRLAIQQQARNVSATVSRLVA